jgi:hypothetical protein
MLLTQAVFSCRLALPLACVCALALGACSPKLHEGTYSCKSDDQCPDGWSCDDELCYSKAHVTRAGAGAGVGGSRPSAGSGGAGSGGAAGSSDAAYEVCDAGASCSSGSCMVGPDNSALHGVCEQRCTADSGCPASGAQPGVCLLGAGVCVPGCASGADCPAPLDCHDIAIGPMQTRAVCLEVVNPNLLGTTACMPGDMASCGRGAACAYSPDTTPPAGVCSYRCDTAGCPQGGTCLEIFPGVRQCFKPCTGPADCGALMCGTFDAKQLCIPPGWAGLVAPLPMPPMMTM